MSSLHLRILSLDQTSIRCSRSSPSRLQYLRSLLTLCVGQALAPLAISYKTASTMAIDDMETVGDAYSSCNPKILSIILFAARNGIYVKSFVALNDDKIAEEWLICNILGGMSLGLRSKCL